MEMSGRVRKGGWEKVWGELITDEAKKVKREIEWKKGVEEAKAEEEKKIDVAKGRDRLSEQEWEISLP